MSTKTKHDEPPALTPEVLTEDDQICPECPHPISVHEEDEDVDGVLYCTECDCAIELDEGDDPDGALFDDDDEDEDDDEGDDEDPDGELI